MLCSALPQNPARAGRQQRYADKVRAVDYLGSFLLLNYTYSTSSKKRNFSLFILFGDIMRCISLWLNLILVRFNGTEPYVSMFVLLPQVSVTVNLTGISTMSLCTVMVCMNSFTVRSFSLSDA